LTSIKRPGPGWGNTPRDIGHQENNVKARWILAIASPLALAAVPITSQAGPREAVDACVSSFVETYIPEHRVVRVKKELPETKPLTMMYPTRGRYTIALSAHEARSGKEVAHARCVVSTRGDVIVLDSPADSSYVAKADFAVSVGR
jgi:hypothetical protein